MRRIVLMTTLAVLVALSLLVSVGFASAKPNGHVVRPGESIQKAIKAAHPGDTIVVLGGVHHESVAIKKDGISLRGRRRAQAAGKALLLLRGVRLLRSVRQRIH